MYNNKKHKSIYYYINRGGDGVQKRYFVINQRSNVLHIYGCCRQTKPRSVPIRLFDTPQEAEAYAGRPLVLCKLCQKNAEK